MRNRLPTAQPVSLFNKLMLLLARSDPLYLSTLAPSVLAIACCVLWGPDVGLAAGLTSVSLLLLVNWLWGDAIEEYFHRIEY